MRKEVDAWVQYSLLREECCFECRALEEISFGHVTKTWLVNLQFRDEHTNDSRAGFGYIHLIQTLSLMERSPLAIPYCRTFTMRYSEDR